MIAQSTASGAEDAPPHYRWSRTAESTRFFIDEDRLRLAFYALVAGCAFGLALLGVGLWRLRAASLAPPVFWGIAGGWVFGGPAAIPAAPGDGDLDRQFSDTVEELFGRTEKGQPPELRDFCTPDALSEAGRAFHGPAVPHPAAFIQSLTVLGSRTVAARAGFREVCYRGLISFRSQASGQLSPIYLDCRFVAARPSGINATGWRLAGVSSIARDEYFRPERERAIRRLLDLPAHPDHE
jgi:hypothetical protein